MNDTFKNKKSIWSDRHFWVSALLHDSYRQDAALLLVSNSNSELQKTARLNAQAYHDSLNSG
jgi:hypothetical protein